MKFLARFIFHIFSNALALLAASYFIKGFSLGGDFLSLLIAALIFTLINAFLLPVLKLILTPLVVLTLGLFTIIINAIGLYLLDRFSDFIKISGLESLIFATLIIGLANLIINFSAKKTFGRGQES